MRQPLFSHNRSTNFGSTAVGAAVALSLAICGQLMPFTANEAAAHDGAKREGFNEPFILSGLKNFKVYVGKLDAYATEHGASEEHIKHSVIEGLAPCHINIVESEPDCAKPGASKSGGCGPSDTPLLYLKVKVIPDGGSSKGAAYSVDLSLVEKAHVSRNKKELMVSVWNKETVGRLGDDVKATIDEQVATVLKDFHRDYLLANSSDSSKDVPEDNHGKAKLKHRTGHQ